jgi:cytochrome c oxidase assembly protein subunit 15
MSGSPNNPWLRRFALMTALVTLVLIGIGGLVTSHGAGMAVPDWPNTYGYNMFLFPLSHWVGGILYEHSHRLVAALVGFLTTILAAWLWARETRKTARWAGLAAILGVLLLMGIRKMPVYIALASLAPMAIGWSFYQIQRQPGSLRWWGVMAFAAVILQGVLGGLRVVLFKDQIGVVHATLAQLFFVLVCLIALFTTKWWRNSIPSGLAGRESSATGLNRALLLTTLLMLGQLMLGATMRHQHAGLAIPDFPLAYGKIWPAMDNQSVLHYNQQRMEVIETNPITPFQIGLQMAHRLVGLLILCAAAFCAWSSLSRLGRNHPVSKLSLCWLGLVLLQGVLGAATIWSNKAADIATGHVITGALCLCTGTLLTVISSRLAPSRVAVGRPAKVLPALASQSVASPNFR